MATKKSATPKRNTAPKLSQRGVAAVAVTVAGLVALAGAGHAGAAALGGAALYLLLTGGVARVATKLPTARRALRGMGWSAVAVAGLMAAQGTTAPGGATLGFALAAALATALRLTARR